MYMNMRVYRTANRGNATIPSRRYNVKFCSSLSFRLISFHRGNRIVLFIGHKCHESETTRPLLLRFDLSMFDPSNLSSLIFFLPKLHSPLTFISYQFFKNSSSKFSMHFFCRMQSILKNSPQALLFPKRFAKYLKIFVHRSIEGKIYRNYCRSLKSHYFFFCLQIC